MGIVDPLVARKVEELKEHLPIVEVDGRSFYLAEGDLLLKKEEDLADYLAHAAKVEPPNVLVGLGGEGLTGIVENHQFVRWPLGEELTYSVNKGSFDSPDQYEMACDNMEKATRDWESACGVSFRHVRERDDERDGASQYVVFTVQLKHARMRWPAGGRLYASAFYPNAEERILNIYPSYFTPPLEFDEVGVFRHELGHILGFRHEHIRPEAPERLRRQDVDESALATDDPFVTVYDSSSVMHYLCDSVGNSKLEITDLDREGAQKIYCLPLSQFRFAS